MLVTDPRQRASLNEIMNHSWLTKYSNGPPPNFLPQREPLQLPLDPEVINKMTGFDFGSAEYITAQLTRIIGSDEYQHAVRAVARKQYVQTPEAERKRGVFDFYKRRNSTTSRDKLDHPSSEAVQFGADPVNAFSPLISVYYLAREKQERERTESNPGALSLPKSPGEKPFQMPDLPAPEAAYTNPATYEMAGEPPTGGRSRPRARTHGEDEIVEGLHKVNLNLPTGTVSPAIIASPSEQTPVKKESAAAGLLRRFSTRKQKDSERERGNNPPTQSLAVSSAGEPVGRPRKSFSVRRTRERDVPSSASLQPAGNQPNQPELLTPPSAGETFSRRLKGLGRSTSVNSADLRRRMTRRGVSEGAYREPAQMGTSGRSSVTESRTKPGDAASDEVNSNSRPPVPALRTKSLGHARRESMQARRARREMARETDLPEETDQELAENADHASGSGRSSDNMKPVYLKGLFSVSTTSTKPLPVIRADIVRVLKQLGVDYTEIKGGYSCRHAPSIDGNNSADDPYSAGQPRAVGGSHKRKISFGGFMGSERDRDESRDRQRPIRTPKAPRSRQAAPDRSFTNSEDSDESDGRDERRPAAAGETSTHVQSDLGKNMVLKFEIFIVKVPLLSLHGIQFKKVDGDVMKYKEMAQEILKTLRL